MNFDQIMRLRNLRYQMQKQITWPEWQYFAKLLNIQREAFANADYKLPDLGESFSLNNAKSAGQHTLGTFRRTGTRRGYSLYKSSWGSD